MISPELIQISTWHNVELALQVLDSQSELQRNSGSLGSLLMESMLLCERIYMESILLTDERWILYGDHSPYVIQDGAHFVLLGHR
jgi:hypothetical protein